MRRPIAAREAGWAKKTAQSLARLGISPNAVSCMSVVFALLAAVCLAATPHVHTLLTQAALYLGAALCIQGRLLCNLFDGMLAVEWNRTSALGPIFNEFPDRPADVLILVGCGLSLGPVWLSTLGWVAAALALLTAYTRALGTTIGAGEYFTGPMAKPQRMATATIASVLGAGEVIIGQPPRVMALALILVCLGCVVTVGRRLKLIAHDLKSRDTTPSA